jgi:hypothetical protein
LLRSSRERAAVWKEAWVPEVRPFNLGMIEEYLWSKEVNYSKTGESLLHGALRHNDKLGCRLLYAFAAAGVKGQILVIKFSPDKQIPRDDWGRALAACNTWMRTRHWPLAYLKVEPNASDESGRIILEASIGLEQGVHQELLNAFSDRVRFGADGFCRWAYQELGLWY